MPEKSSGDTERTDVECEDFPQIDLYQRAEIHNAGRRSSLDELSAEVLTAQHEEGVQAVS